MLSTADEARSACEDVMLLAILTMIVFFFFFFLGGGGGGLVCAVVTHLPPTSEIGVQTPDLMWESW